MKKMVDDIIELIKDNKNGLEKIKKEDNEICAINFEIEKLIEVISNYENKKRNIGKGKKIFVTHLR